VEGETRMIAEGARTVTSALALADRHGVSLPICAEVGEVLFAAKPPAEALAALLGRAVRPEHDELGARAVPGARSGEGSL
jgi:glycerol-3-phosphate dehydrogenase (NAD(P)+)